MAVVRLADLLSGLSRVADLGFGLPAGEAVRASALSAGMAGSLDLPDDDVRAALYTGLLLHLGCIGYAHETARVFDNELVMSAASARTNLAKPWDVLMTFLPALTRGRRPLQRARLAAVTVARGKRHGVGYTTTACEVGRDAARRLHLPEDVQHSIYHSYEWWNGGGAPMGLAGDDIPVAARLAALATTASLFDTMGGVSAAVDAVRQQSGGTLDPLLVSHFIDRADELLGAVNAADPSDLVLDAEPEPAMSVDERGLARVAAVFGDIGDLKAPHMHGHSSGVARLARAGGERLRMSSSDLEDIHLAGLLHDVGRVAVSNAVWEKPDRLAVHEWDQVRLHAYHSERILACSPRLAMVAHLVGLHHERCDGSGYHRGHARSALQMPARLLAAADAYQAMTQRRPHRLALEPEQAGQQLRDDASAGLLDADAVAAVLDAAGHAATGVRRELPAGLSGREVEVLRLVAEGCSNRQVAERLVISRRTAEHHVQHIYAKIGVSSRAAAALFAMEHDLLTA